MLQGCLFPLFTFCSPSLIPHNLLLSFICLVLPLPALPHVCLFLLYTFYVILHSPQLPLFLTYLSPAFPLWQVLNTFARSILLCGREADHDEVLALRVVAFLMDTHEEVMRPPEDLSVLAHRRLALRHRSQVVGREGRVMVQEGRR